MLGVALLRAWRGVVAPAVGLLALAAVGGNTQSLNLAPLESASLVAVALLAWWSMDERQISVSERGVDNGRAATSAALVVAAGGLSVLAVSMASVASASLVGPAVGAVGVATIGAVLWSTARLRRYQGEHRR